MSAGDADARFVHSQALCESEQIGPGTRVWAFAHILPGARLGRDCNICDAAYVENGAVLGDRVTVKNATLVFAGVTCEDEVFLGPNVLLTNDLRPRSPRMPASVRRATTWAGGIFSTSSAGRPRAISSRFAAG